MTKHTKKTVKAYGLAMNISGRNYLDMGLIFALKRNAKIALSNRQCYGYKVVPVTITYHA